MEFLERTTKAKKSIFVRKIKTGYDKNFGSYHYI